ncbi:MAG: hypothetical protein ACI8XC_003946 [Gammaproteobacteria bacterium]|jgi:hypothetical protein
MMVRSINMLRMIVKMTSNLSPISDKSVNLVLGIIFLCTGYLYYLFVRGFDPLNIFPMGLAPADLPILISWGSWPTFLHTAGFVLISYTISRSINRIGITGCWIGLVVLIEVAQTSTLVSSTFDLSDVLAGLLAGVVALSIQSGTKIICQQFESSISHFASRIYLTTLIVIGAGTNLASSYGPDCCENGENPVYLSYESLREPIKIQHERPLANPGKIYLFEQYLLINERNQGIHIFDNADPMSPTSIGFIGLPGNLDMAIKEGYLYADSFVDMVVIDLNDQYRPVFFKRIENAFPWDPYQAIDPTSNIYFYDLDEEKGVVIGYE